MVESISFYRDFDGNSSSERYIYKNVQNIVYCACRLFDQDGDFSKSDKSTTSLNVSSVNSSCG